ncbi:MAG: hypothetical protein IKW83_08660 [Muribaculaceae bacterium]|nr:hypothetical protein [Muribaculaceae bacterium]
MKKVFSIFALAVLLLGFTACNDDDDDYRIQKITGEILNNSVDIEEGQSVCVATSAISMEWNVSTSTISLNYTVAVTTNSTATVSLTDVPIEPNITYNCYTFSAANGGNGITNLTGYYRPETGCLYIEFLVFGTHRVMSTANLYYPYLKYNITNSETSASKESPNGEMMIYINPKDMSAQLAMGNLALSENSGTIQQMVFYGLHAEPTATGYHVTYSGDQRSSDGTYVLNAFDGTISGSGKVVDGTFTIDEKFNGTFNGKAFAN